MPITNPTLPYDYNDVSSSWSTPDRVINGLNNQYGSCSVDPSGWSGFLEFTLVSGGGDQYSNAVDIDADYYTPGIDSVDIDLSDNNGSSWADEYEGPFDNHTVTDINFSGGTEYIDTYRVRFYNSAGTAKTCKFYETNWADSGAPGGGGQLIMITAKLLFPFFWLKQGRQSRRGFLKHTILGILGIK